MQMLPHVTARIEGLSIFLMLLHVSTVLQYQGWHLALPETCEPSAVSKEAVVSEVSTKSTKTSKVAKWCGKTCGIATMFREISRSSQQESEFQQAWQVFPTVEHACQRGMRHCFYSLMVYFILLPTSSSYSIVFIHVGMNASSVAHLPQGHSIFQTTQ